MSPDLIDKVSWVGDEVLAYPITGIIVHFSGLGGTLERKTEADDVERAWGARGGLVLVPRHNPWAWMNPDTVDFVDKLLDAVIEKYHVPSDVPIVASGGSMGGHGALLFTIKSRHKIVRCFANCPVCDLLYHYSERGDLPATMHSAFRSYGDITELLMENSVVHQAHKLPGIDYMIIHGFQDEAVSKQHHSDKLCRIMRESGHNLEYIELDMGHCWPMPDETRKRWINFVPDGLLPEKHRTL